MKRLSATAVLLGALTVGLTGCGGADESGSDAAGSRGNPQPTTSVTSAPVAPPPPPAVEPAPSTDAPVATPQPADSTSGPASQTPCSTFKEMDTASEQALLERVLAENPGSKFEGSPNVAMGTAKLVCLAHSKADEPVAVALGVATE